MGIKIVSNLTKYMTFCNLRLIQVETLHHIKVSSKKNQCDLFTTFILQ